MNDAVAVTPEVEKVARVLCKQASYNPDKLYEGPLGPTFVDGRIEGRPACFLWRNFIKEAELVLAACPVSNGFNMSHDAILISAENPGGWPLEDLLMKLCDEIQAKNRKIVGIDEPAAYRYQGTNSALMSILIAAAEFQIEALQYAKDNPFDLTKK